MMPARETLARPQLGRAHPRARAARRLACAAALLLSVASSAHAGRPSSIPPANQPVVGPQGTLEAVARGYRERSAD